VIKKASSNSNSVKDKILQTTRDLGKQYSKLELASHTLQKRSDELLRICKSSIKNGRKDRAIIYASEVSELRKFLSVVSSTQISLERAILRLETYSQVCPTLQEIRTVYSDVKEVIKSVANIMPNMYPEMDSLNNVVNEILEVTQLSSVSPIEPVIKRDLATDIIIEEASTIIEGELKRSIPEPPKSITQSIKKDNSPVYIGQKVALTADGSEISIPIVAQRNSSVDDRNEFFDSKSFTAKKNGASRDLLLDYLYRKNGEIDIDECARDLNMSKSRILQMLDLLKTQRKIKIEQ